MYVNNELLKMESCRIGENYKNARMSSVHLCMNDDIKQTMYTYVMQLEVT